MNRNESRSCRRRSWRAAMVTATLLTLVASPVLAQRHRSGPPPPDVRAERLQQTLDLTDAQAERLETIFHEQRERVRALRDEGADHREARRDALRAVRAETHERIGEVLTGPQMERFEQLAKRHRKHRHQDGPPHERRSRG